MIRLVEASYASSYPREIDAMFRSRAETFRDRLGWEVVVENGYERDRFDACNPLYLISVDPERGDYRGSLRLLPTLGPNMLRDVFPQLLNGDDAVADPTIWESSRICVATRDGQCERTPGGLNAALCELILGIGEVAVLAGLTRIVSVFDARMLRVLRATGCDLTIIGTPRRIGDVMCYAALFETGPGPLAKFRASLGVTETVFAPDAYEWIALAGERRAGRSRAAVDLRQG